MRETKASCPYCGVGCGVIIEHDDHHVIGVKGDPTHPANFGRLCTKGSTLHLSMNTTQRLHYPMLRESKQADARRVGWNDALNTAAEKFAKVIAQHGPDAVGFYVSGQLLTEDYYVFNKLVKGLIGTNNIDTNSRLCMSSAVAAYKQTLGADAPPCSYEDFDHSDCLLIAGANPAYAHPIAYRRIEAAKANRPEMRIIVIDPRRTDTAAAADLHLAILPGTDIWLLNAILHVLIWDGYVDMPWIRAHTEGFAALREHVREITPSVAAQVCGVSAEDIMTAARWWGEAQAPMSLWCQGLNQSHHGTHNGTSLIALSLAVGKIGQPGCGPFSLTGQPNAMGGREVGGLANLLSAHRDLANPVHRQEVADLWGIESVPEKPGLSAVELFEAARKGQIKALWIACTNPAHSMPNQAAIREALERCEFVVLQEIYANTETARYADLLLPASGWAEKEGTVTNSERRITHIRPAIPSPGEARSDWRIARDFARVLGEKLNRGETAKRLFAYESPESIFLEHARSTQGRDLDISALNYSILDMDGPQQWPYRGADQTPSVRLYTDARFQTATGKASFVIPSANLTAERVNASYPIQLTTGRLRDQWHGMSRTGKVVSLFNHAGEPRVDLHAADMARRGIKERDFVCISSRRGKIILRAHASDEVRSAQAFIPMHWGLNHLNSAGANELTLDVTDPYSRQPEFKHAAIQLERVDLPYQAVFVRNLHTPDEVLDASAQLSSILRQCRYGAVHLAGSTHPTLILTLADAEPINEGLIAQIDAILGLSDAGCLAYKDLRRGISKKALMENGILTGIHLSGEVLAEQWLTEVIVEHAYTPAMRPWLFAPVSKPPLAQSGRGKIVCNCFNVSETEISRRCEAGDDLATIQQTLKCGTSCGSCVPELKRLISRVPSHADSAL